MQMENELKLNEILKPGTIPEIYSSGSDWAILNGDTLKLVKAFLPGTLDAVITDPPYAS